MAMEPPNVCAMCDGTCEAVPMDVPKLHADGSRLRKLMDVASTSVEDLGSPAFRRESSI